MSKPGERQSFLCNFKKIIYDFMVNALEAENTPKSTFIQHAVIEKMMFLETFRRELLNILRNQESDRAYYEALESFKRIDAIREEHRKSADAIIKIVYHLK